MTAHLRARTGLLWYGRSQAAVPAHLSASPSSERVGRYTHSSGVLTFYCSCKVLGYPITQGEEREEGNTRGNFPGTACTAPCPSTQIRIRGCARAGSEQRRGCPASHQGVMQLWKWLHPLIPCPRQAACTEITQQGSAEMLLKHLGLALKC